MQAVFQLSGFQFSAQEGDTLRVPRQKVEVGQAFEIDHVLLVKDKETALIGTPTVAGAHIEAELLANGRGDKVIVYKFKRRTKYRRTRGHRQDYSEIKIKKIVAPH
ncbi:MAG: 50S ribosomal protein L21 [Candidatus Zixiibacteriota bacterium]